MYTHDIDSHFSLPLLSEMMGTHEVEELDKVGRYLTHQVDQHVQYLENFEKLQGCTYPLF